LEISHFPIPPNALYFSLLKQATSKTESLAILSRFLFGFRSLKSCCSFTRTKGKAENSMDSLDWSKKYEVLSISRLYLRSLGFSTESINVLTDEDMQRIADTYNNQNYLSFEEDIRFLIACEIVEKRGEAHDEEPLRQDRDA
jgi:hypothetical protein